jgi:hypothetical protein
MKILRTIQFDDGALKMTSAASCGGAVSFSGRSFPQVLKVVKQARRQRNPHYSKCLE